MVLVPFDPMNLRLYSRIKSRLNPTRYVGRITEEESAPHGELQGRQHSGHQLQEYGIRSVIQRNGSEAIWG